MEKKPKEIASTLLIGLLTLLVVYHIGEKTTHIRPKYFWNIVLAIPISLGSILVLYLNKKIINVSLLKIVLSTSTLHIFIYLFVYSIVKLPLVGGFFTFYIGIPCCFYLYMLMNRFIFKIKINESVLIAFIAFIIGVVIVLAFESFFTKLKNDSFHLFFLLTIILVVAFPLSVKEKKDEIPNL